MESETEIIMGSLTKKKGKNVNNYVTWSNNNQENIREITAMISALFPDRKGELGIDEVKIGEILYRLRCVKFDPTRIS